MLKMGSGFIAPNTTKKISISKNQRKQNENNKRRSRRDSQRPRRTQSQIHHRGLATNLFAGACVVEHIDVPLLFSGVLILCLSWLAYYLCENISVGGINEGRTWIDLAWTILFSAISLLLIFVSLDI